MELLLIVGVVALLFWLLRRHAVTTDAGALAGPVGWARGTDWHVVGPLARADSRRLLRHPAFIAGVVLTPLIILAATDGEHIWWKISTGIALGLVPLGWLTIVAANLATLRPRRTGADELFSTLPAPQPVRTTAGLTAGIGPVLVAAVVAGAAVLVVALTRDGLRGSPRWAEIAAGLLIVAGSVCVGVAVARWLPSAGFGVLAVVATFLLQARFLDVATWPWNRSESDPARFLGFLAEPTAVRDPFLEFRPSGWHLLYLAGLVVVMAGVALAREGMRRPVAIVLAVGLVADGDGRLGADPPAVAQVREDDMVAYLTDPGAHQVCRTSASVRYSAYPEFSADVPEWQRHASRRRSHGSPRRRSTVAPDSTWCNDRRSSRATRTARPWRSTRACPPVSPPGCRRARCGRPTEACTRRSKRSRSRARSAMSTASSSPCRPAAWAVGLPPRRPAGTGDAPRAVRRAPSSRSGPARRPRRTALARCATWRTKPTRPARPGSRSPDGTTRRCGGPSTPWPTPGRPWRS